MCFSARALYADADADAAGSFHRSYVRYVMNDKGEQHDSLSNWKMGSHKGKRKPSRTFPIFVLILQLRFVSSEPRSVSADETTTTIHNAGSNHPSIFEYRASSLARLDWGYVEFQWNSLLPPS